MARNIKQAFKNLGTTGEAEGSKTLQVKDITRRAKFAEQDYKSQVKEINRTPEKKDSIDILGKAALTLTKAGVEIKKAYNDARTSEVLKKYQGRYKNFILSTNGKNISDTVSILEGEDVKEISSALESDLGFLSKSERNGILANFNERVRTTNDKIKMDRIIEATRLKNREMQNSINTLENKVAENPNLDITESVKNLVAENTTESMDEKQQLAVFNGVQSAVARGKARAFTRTNDVDSLRNLLKEENIEEYLGTAKHEAALSFLQKYDNPKAREARRAAAVKLATETGNGGLLHTLKVEARKNKQTGVANAIGNFLATARKNSKDGGKPFTQKQLDRITSPLDRDNPTEAKLEQIIRKGGRKFVESMNKDPIGMHTSIFGKEATNSMPLEYKTRLFGVAFSADEVKDITSKLIEKSAGEPYAIEKWLDGLQAESNTVTVSAARDQLLAHLNSGDAKATYSKAEIETAELRLSKSALSGLNIPDQRFLRGAGEDISLPSPHENDGVLIRIRNNPYLERVYEQIKITAARETAKQPTGKDWVPDQTAARKEMYADRVDEMSEVYIISQLDDNKGSWLSNFWDKSYVRFGVDGNLFFTKEELNDPEASDNVNAFGDMLRGLAKADTLLSTEHLELLKYVDNNQITTMPIEGTPFLGVGYFTDDGIFIQLEDKSDNPLITSRANILNHGRKALRNPLEPVVKQTQMDLSKGLTGVVEIKASNVQKTLEAVDIRKNKNLNIVSSISNSFKTDKQDDILQKFSTLAISKVETNFGADTRISKAGAKGQFQIMPETRKRLDKMAKDRNITELLALKGKSINDPKVAAVYSAFLMKDNISRLKTLSKRLSASDRENLKVKDLMIAAWLMYNGGESYFSLKTIQNSIYGERSKSQTGESTNYIARILEGIPNVLSPAQKKLTGGHTKKEHQDTYKLQDKQQALFLKRLGISEKELSETLNTKVKF